MCVHFASGAARLGRRHAPMQPARALLVLACVTTTAAAVRRNLSRAEALAELRLPARFDEAALKRALRKRALETHPDKGGSSDAFLRVSQAYETLHSGGTDAESSRPRARRTRPTGGDDGADSGTSAPSQEEMMLRAEEMLGSVLDELLESLESLDVDRMVDAWMGEPSGGGTGGWLLRKAAKVGLRAAGKLLSDAVENGEVRVNGRTVRTDEVRQWREQLRARAREQRGEQSSWLGNKVRAEMDGVLYGLRSNEPPPSFADSKPPPEPEGAERRAEDEL
jgi:curved DNA-binding protein CbpA